jgi:hypothetical protein
MREKKEREREKKERERQEERRAAVEAACKTA